MENGDGDVNYVRKHRYNRKAYPMYVQLWQTFVRSNLYYYHNVITFAESSLKMGI